MQSVLFGRNFELLLSVSFIFFFFFSFNTVQSHLNQEQLQAWSAQSPVCTNSCIAHLLFLLLLFCFSTLLDCRRWFKILFCMDIECVFLIFLCVVFYFVAFLRRIRLLKGSISLFRYENCRQFHLSNSNRNLSSWRCE